MAEGNGSVYWDSFMVTDGPVCVTYFDGATPDDDEYEYGWLDSTTQTASVRRMRDPLETFGPSGEGTIGGAGQLLEIAARRADQGLTEELTLLLDYAIAAFGPGSGPANQIRADIDRADEVMSRRIAAARIAMDKAASADFHIEKGRSLASASHWKLAADEFRNAVALQPDSPGTLYELAAVLDKLRDPESSKRASLDAIEHDDHLPFDALSALDVYPDAFGARRLTGLYVARRLPEIRRRADEDRSTAEASSLRVFSYWAQGEGQAPPLVQRCLKRLAEAAGELHVLSDASLPYYTEIPERILQAVGNNKTYLSDIVRLDLLHRYAGTWVDATCWVDKSVQEFLRDRMGHGFFAPQYKGPRISSWFMAAQPGSKIVALLRAALWLWWEENSYLPHYYHVHHVFEMLYWLDDGFRDEWDHAVHYSSRCAHALQSMMLQPYSPTDVEQILADAPVQKLSYKFDARSVRPESVVSHIVRDQLAN